MQMAPWLLEPSLPHEISPLNRIVPTKGSLSGVLAFATMGGAIQSEGRCRHETID